MDTESTRTIDALDRADMARLIRGEESAFNGLIDRHATRLFHYLVRLLQNESEAEELAQESFVRVFRNAHRFNPKQRFSTWLYSLAINLVRDRHRRHTRHPHVPLHSQSSPTGPLIQDTLTAPQPDPAAQLESAEIVDAVRQAVAELPDDLRIPLILAEYDNASYKEIATILGTSPKAVEMKLYRARKLLRARLSPWLDPNARVEPRTG
jgi:RNA polymerase sigma-70 factor, ECF subfamily